VVRDGTDEGQGGVSDDGNDRCGTIRRRSLTIREAIDELTQLRVVRTYIHNTLLLILH